jgi:hypothetical protein
MAAVLPWIRLLSHNLKAYAWLFLFTAIDSRSRVKGSRRAEEQAVSNRLLGGEYARTSS